MEDGRGFVVCDLNNDGTRELGIISNQQPRFRIAKLNAEVKKKSHVKVKLVGGNTKAEPSVDLSPRDPVGAILVVKTGSQTRMFQLSSGEGFSIQNSRTVNIGLGDFTQIDELEIRWPGGKTTVKKGIVGGTTLEIHERGEEGRHVSAGEEKG